MVRHGGQRQSAWLDLPDTVTGYPSTCSYSTWNRTSTPPMSRQMVPRTAPGLPRALLTRSLFPRKGAGKAPGRASTPILEAAEGIPAEV